MLYGDHRGNGDGRRAGRRLYLALPAARPLPRLRGYLVLSAEVAAVMEKFPSVIPAVCSGDPSGCSCEGPLQVFSAPSQNKPPPRARQRLRLSALRSPAKKSECPFFSPLPHPFGESVVTFNSYISLLPRPFGAGLGTHLTQGGLSKHLKFQKILFERC